jgi:hypothetical protein
VTQGGCLVESIPFQLNVVPEELHVQANRETGVFSGDFEMGIQVRPGPTQVRSSGVVDLVSLFASGTNVQFYSQNQKAIVAPSVTIQISPFYWDLLSGFVYDVVSVLTVTNHTTRDQTIFLNTQIKPLNLISQTVSLLSRSSLVIRPGSNEFVLLALKVSATQVAREIVTVKGSSLLGSVISPVELVVNSASNASTTFYYQITNPSDYSWSIGSPVNVTLASAHGVPGNESWEVDQPLFLMNHGVKLNSNGSLVSWDTVRGPAESQGLLFWVKNRTAAGQVFYAAKIINVAIT